MTIGIDLDETILKTQEYIQLYIYRANKIYLFNASMNYIMLDKTIYIIIKF